MNTANTAIANVNGDLARVEARGNGTGAAFMQFHRPSAYAAYFGIDTDNQWKVGGWSMGATSYPILHTNNFNSYAPTLTGTGASGTWSINVTGSAGSATTAGTVTTAAQPNITSVGTLSSLAVTGNTTSGNFIGTLNGSGANVTSISATNISSGTLAQARLANSSLTVNGTAITLGSSGTVTANTPNSLTFNNGGAGAASGTTFNGGAATTISYNTVGAPSTTGTNASGTWSINVSGSAGSATSATTAGTVTTNAQPNITSVGTLTGLTVSSTISGSVSGSAGTAGTVTTAAQSNITSVGTLTGLTVSSSVIANSGVVLNSYTGATEGAQLTMAYKGVSGLVGQANSTWNLDVDGSNNFRIFRQNSSGNSSTYMILSESTGNIQLGGKLLLGTETSSLAATTGLVAFKNTQVNDYVIVTDTVASSGVYYHMAFAAANTLAGYISGNTNSVNYNTTSDYRLKENVQPMTGALAKISSINPVTFTWKSDGSDGQGFIAHELQAVIPDAVTGTKDQVDAQGNPRYQGIDTSFLVATLTAAIKEQQQEIGNLKTTIQNQQNTINDLITRLENLENNN